jgi:hypothetical protein
MDELKLTFWDLAGMSLFMTFSANGHYILNLICIRSDTSVYMVQIDSGPSTDFTHDF